MERERKGELDKKDRVERVKIGRVFRGVGESFDKWGNYEVKGERWLVWERGFFWEEIEKMDGWVVYIYSLLGCSYWNYLFFGFLVCGLVYIWRRFWFRKL